MLLSQEFKFSAAHKLTGNVGEPLHGHTYKLRVTVKGKPNENGMVMDTREFKEIIQNLVMKKLDNSFLNDLFPQPTMENVIKWIWDELVDLPLYEVTLWETPTTSIAYNGKD